MEFQNQRIVILLSENKKVYRVLQIDEGEKYCRKKDNGGRPLFSLFRNKPTREVSACNRFFGSLFTFNTLKSNSRELYYVIQHTEVNCACSAKRAPLKFTGNYTTVAAKNLHRGDNERCFIVNGHPQVHRYGFNLCILGFNFAILGRDRFCEFEFTTLMVEGGYRPAKTQEILFSFSAWFVLFHE